MCIVVLYIGIWKPSVYSDGVQCPVWPWHWSWQSSAM